MQPTKKRKPGIVREWPGLGLNQRPLIEVQKEKGYWRKFWRTTRPAVNQNAQQVTA